MRRYRGGHGIKSPDARVEAVHFEIVGGPLVRARDVKIVLPERGSDEGSVVREKTLHYLIVASDLKVSHIVAINQVEHALLATAYEQVWHRAGSLIGQQGYSAGTEIGIVQAERGLIVGRDFLLGVGTAAEKQEEDRSPRPAVRAQFAH